MRRLLPVMARSAIVPRVPGIPIVALVVGLCVICKGEHEMISAALIWSADSVTGNAALDSSAGAHQGAVHGVACDVVTETLGIPSTFRFNGVDAFIRTPDAADLNADVFSVAVWFKPLPGTLTAQKPLLVKSAPTHEKPWYQYGLFLLDRPGDPASVSFGVAVADEFHQATAFNAFHYDAWTHVAGVREGNALVLYVNGKEAARTVLPGGTGQRFGRPLYCGAYENLPRNGTYCYAGGMADIRCYAEALSATAARELYATLEGRFGSGGTPTETRTRSAYETELNRALESPRDLWGEQVIAGGEASYDAVEPRLQPLFYSTGRTNREFGPHSLLFSMDGGVPPYIVPLADGSRVYAGTCTSGQWVQVEVGAAAFEVFGSDVDRLYGPRLEDDFRLVLQTTYADGGGVRYVQECTAGFVDGIAHPLAWIRVGLEKGLTDSQQARVRFRCSGLAGTHVRAQAGGTLDGDCITFTLDRDRPVVHMVWSPGEALPAALDVSEQSWARAKARWIDYWDAILSGGMHLELPEARVTHAMRNLLMQNLMLRWRYSLGSAVYHNSFYQPESSDSVAVLGMYGYADAFRDGLQDLLGMSKGAGQYTNWEIGEKLSHAAAYYHFTGDAPFIRRNTPTYLGYIRELAAQHAADPRGLLAAQRMCGDQDYRAYSPFHIMTCWRGIRDLRVIWSDLGDRDAVTACADLDQSLYRALRKAVDECSTALEDGSLFVPNRFYADLPVFDLITATRDGSYWNLCMPYAFSSGFWKPGGQEIERILTFVHGHGGTFLGLLRFNYYPIAVGAYRHDGLPGYATTGVDNVYLPGYVRTLADHDEVDRLILSFYGQLAHGMTRNTYVAGEGDTLGVHPAYRFRSSYGSVCSANNSAKLLTLRLMLLRETFDHASGRPADLHLAPATPRAWLTHGRSVGVSTAPTCFGPVSYRLSSAIRDGEVHFSVSPPTRVRPRTLTLRLRLPEGYRIVSATLAGSPWSRIHAAGGTIDLSGIAGPVNGVLRVSRTDSR